MSMYVIFFALLRSRRYQQSPKNRASPSTTQTACLNTDPGYEEAVTARLSVERKNAMISISKPTLLSMRMKIT